MTWYEVIITRGEPSDAVVITGIRSLLQAIAFLDAAAKRGELAGVAEVHTYDSLQVPGGLLVDLLQHLDQPIDWVNSDQLYPVYLSEV